MSEERMREEAAWGAPVRQEPHWPAILAVLAAVLLYVTLPEKLTYGPTWVVAVLEGALLPPLIYTMVHGRQNESGWQRLAYMALGEQSRFQRAIFLVLTAIVSAANILSLLLLLHALLHHGKSSGYDLIFSSIQIWLTNVIIFGLWYWQLDRGGPGARRHYHHREPDFLFPQMANPDVAPADWTPSFVDYLYVSFTNATAFSPTDTMPLTEWAKLLMLIQSLTSLLTVAFVAARAVNILS